MRKTSADIPSFLSTGSCFYNNPREGNTILLSVSLALFCQVSSVCLHLCFLTHCNHSQAFAIISRYQPHSPHKTARELRRSSHCSVVGPACYLLISICTHPLQHPITFQSHPASIQHPGQIPAMTFRRQPRWTLVRLRLEAGVNKGKEEVTGDF